MNAIGLVDKCASSSGRDALEHRYRFLPPDYTHFYFNGFDHRALDVVFPGTPIAMPAQQPTEG